MFTKILLLAMFYLIKKIYCAKNKNKKLVISLINSTQKGLISLFKIKIFEKKFLTKKKILAEKHFLVQKKFFNQKKFSF